MSRPLHLIGNAHLDPVWLWEWSEGLDAVRATFRAQLDLLKEDPDYVFTCSSSCYYQWVEQTDPAMFEEIRAAVESRRIVPVGGWYIQAEGNTGSGESFARLGLYGQKYFISRFGFRCAGGYLPDTFGHHGNFPALLLGAELNYHVFNRPPDWGLPLPQALFRWVGANGQSVPTYRIAGYSYGGFTAGDVGDSTDLQRHIDRALATISPQMPAGMFFYGVGNHGGGPTRQTLRELSEHGADYAAGQGFDVAFSTPDAYFASVEDQALPEHAGSIQKVSIGCYSGWNRLKRAIRHAEQRLFEAEALTTAAHAFAEAQHRMTQLAEEFEPLWEQVLFVLDHDIATGCAIRAAETDALQRMEHVIARTDQLGTFAAASLANRADTRPCPLPPDARTDEYIQPLVLVSPTTGPAQLPAEVELIGLPHGYRVFDHDGAELITQPLPPRALAFNEGHGRRRFLIDLPGDRPNLSVLSVVPRSESDPPATEPDDPATASATIRSGDVALRWDRARGVEGVSLRGEELFEPGPPWVLNILDDDTDSWGHSERGLNELILAYEFFTDPIAHVETSQTERGPIRHSVRSIYEADVGRIVLTASLITGFEGVLLDADVDWRGRYKMLKMSFHTGLTAPHRARGKIPFCHETVETDGRELPLQEWLHLQGAGGGMGLISDTTYSYSVRGSTMDATLLRSVPYAWDFSTPLECPDELEVTDQGRHRFRMLLVPGAFDAPRLERLTRELFTPPRIVRDHAHPGLSGTERTDTWLTCDPANVGIYCVKRTEADDGVAVRLAELSGQPARATITWCGERTASVDLAALGITTVVLRDDGRIEETSFLEGL